jgi:hypothetical protein
MATIPARKRKNRLVQEALINHTCVSDIQGGLPVGVLLDYLQLWDILLAFSCGLKLKIDTYGASHPMVNILLR